VAVNTAVHRIGARVGFAGGNEEKKI